MEHPRGIRGPITIRPRQKITPMPGSECSDGLDQLPSRRRFFQSARIGALAGLGAALNLDAAARPQAAIRNPPTPEAALEELMHGNERFATERLTHHEQDLAILKLHTVEKQEPFATVLSCSDSRVPVELIFDQSIGHIFVVRIAGNIVTPEVSASVEYSGALLGVRLVLVMGHGGCGAVKAAIGNQKAPGQISSLYPHIEPAVKEAGPNLEATIKANARIQAALVRSRSAVISDLVTEKKLRVLAAYYDLASGKVALLD
jgi:carbonic anhydrase